MSTARVTVSGVTFKFPTKVLETDLFRQQTLYNLISDGSNSADGSCHVFINRSSECFAAILSYYETDKLHMPLSVCPAQFKDELEYWGIDPGVLQSCCLYRYFTFLDDVETHQSFKDSQTPRDPMMYTVPATNSIQKIRQKTWSIVDNRDKTVLTRIYTGLLFIVVVVSITGMALSTESRFRRSLTICEYIEYLKETGSSYYNLVRNLHSNTNCNSASKWNDKSEGFDIETILEQWNADWLSDWLDEYYDYEVSTSATTMSTTTMFPFVVNKTQTTDGNNMWQGSGSRQRSKPSLPVVSAQHHAFDILDYFTVSFFTIDFLLRVLSCPSFWRYFISIINVLDAVALLASYVNIGVTSTRIEERYLADNWVKSLEAIQILRVLRILRISKDVRASRVLAFSLRQNLKDLLLLSLFLLFSVSFFSTLMYFIESRETLASIPEGWYWAVITLTTVGYGDISPQSGLGRFIACICAILGVLLLAITLPMFVNNFLTLYHYSSIDDSIEMKKQAKKLRKQTPSKASLFARFFTERRNTNQVFVQTDTKRRQEDTQ